MIKKQHCISVLYLTTRCTSYVLTKYFTKHKYTCCKQAITIARRLSSVADIQISTSDDGSRKYQELSLKEQHNTH